MKANEKLQRYFTETLILLEAKQFADSITRIKAKRPVQGKSFSNKLPYIFKRKSFKQPLDLKKTHEYLLEFDNSLGLPQLWLNEVELHCLNVLRQEINSVSLYRGHGFIIRPNVQ